MKESLSSTHAAIREDAFSHVSLPPAPFADLPKFPASLTSYQKARLNLENTRFKRTIDVDFFTRGSLVIMLKRDGSFALFSDIPLSINKRSIAHIDAGNEDLGVRISGWGSLGSAFAINLLPLGETKPLNNPNVMSNSIAISKQLELLDFSPYQGNTNLWTKRFKLPSGTHTLLFVVENEQIKRACYSLSARIHDVFLPGTFIIDHSRRWNGGNFGFDRVFTFGNALAEFQLTNSKSKYSIENIRLKREATPDEVGVTKISSFRERSGFTIGGRNSTDTIFSLTEINNQSIADLEHRMRSGVNSKLKLLGEDESLLQTLATDNAFVLEKNFSHQDLASHLKYAVAIARKFSSRFTYRGNQFEITSIDSPEPRESPFRDKSNTTVDYCLVNLTNRRSILFPEYLPGMIERYGFYAGIYQEYRLEPVEIMKLFGLLRQ